MFIKYRKSTTTRTGHTARQLVFFKRFNFLYLAGRFSLFDMKKHRRLFSVGITV